MRVFWSQCRPDNNLFSVIVMVRFIEAGEQSTQRNIPYMYIVVIYRIYSFKVQKQVEKPTFGKLFWSVLQLQLVLINFIFTDNVCILCLSCNVKKFKTTAKLSEKSRNKYHSNHFQQCSLSCPCLYCYCFLPLLYMNQVPVILYQVHD